MTEAKLVPIEDVIGERAADLLNAVLADSSEEVSTQIKASLTVILQTMDGEMKTLRELDTKLRATGEDDAGSPVAAGVQTTGIVLMLAAIGTRLRNDRSSTRLFLDTFVTALGARVVDGPPPDDMRGRRRGTVPRRPGRGYQPR